jgi:hypothetical protein
VLAVEEGRRIFGNVQKYVTVSRRLWWLYGDYGDLMIFDDFKNQIMVILRWLFGDCSD